MDSVVGRCEKNTMEECVFVRLLFKELKLSGCCIEVIGVDSKVLFERSFSDSIAFSVL